MSSKSFVIATVIVFLFILVTDFLFHGIYLKDIYQLTADLWRSEAEMQDYYAWITFGQFIISVAFVVLYVYAFKNGSVLKGLAYGLLIGIIFTGNFFIWYAVAPYSIDLVINWIIGIIVQFAVAGLIVGYICQPSIKE